MRWPGLAIILILFCVGLGVANAGRSRPSTVVEFGTVSAFGPAGGFGGGPLQEGQLFPPGGDAAAALLREGHCLEFAVHTSGLPEGAHSVWWVVFNRPEGCAGGPGHCDVPDVGRPGADGSLFWATGTFVGADGRALVRDRHCIGDDLGFPAGRPPEQHILGSGLANPDRAEVHVVFRYHGLRHPDPVLAYHQTHSFNGSCHDQANAHPDGSCFDPQLATFPGSAPSPGE